MTCNSPRAADMWCNALPTEPHLAWFVPNGTDLPFSVAFNGQNYYGAEQHRFMYHGSLNALSLSCRYPDLQMAEYL